MSAYIYAPLRIPLGELAQDRFGDAASPGRSTTAWARQVIESVWARSTPAPKTLGALQLVQANALLESGYGRGWGGLCAGSNNWGAVQAGSAPPCGPGACEYGDTHPGAGGYQWCFKAYSSPQAGCADFIRIMLRSKTRAVINTGNATAVCAAMYAEHYYEGSSTVPKEAIANRARGVYARAKKIAATLDEPLHVALDSDAESAPGLSGPEKGAIGALITLAGLLAYRRYRRA